MQTADIKNKPRVLSEFKKKKEKNPEIMLEKSLINRFLPLLHNKPRNGKFGCRKITLIIVSKAYHLMLAYCTLQYILHTKCLHGYLILVLNTTCRRYMPFFTAAWDINTIPMFKRIQY